MASLHQLAACIGIPKNFSVLGDFLGFFRRTLPPDPTGAAVAVSLLRQAKLLKGPHFNLNIIAIGVENFTDTEDIQTDYSVFKIRNIYAQVGVGVGRILYFQVTVADANGLDMPTTEDQLSEIGHKWVVNNDALDVATPFAMNVPSNGGMTLGLSPQPGPCVEKDDKGMNGSVVGLFGSEQTARTFAHEVGHNLGLGHKNSNPENLMCQSGSASSIRDSVILTSAQGGDIKDHCLMKPSC
jgi:hypothetical protein